MKKRLLALIMAGTLSLSLLGSTAVMADDGGEELADEQVLNLRLTDLKLLDVNDARNFNEFQILTEVQEGLFRTFTDENGVDVVENAGCTSYEISDDNLTYTFHLRDGCVWSDGVPVTAQNYVDSWLRLINPESAFAYAFLATGIVGAEAYYNGEGAVEDVAIQYIDDLTFSCTLSEPDATFIKKVGMVCFYPIRKDLIDAAEAEGKDWTNDYTLHVFNGPFIISDRVLENSMTLTKNENYWDKDNVTLTQVNLRVVDETSTQAQLMESQQLDVLILSDVEYVDMWQPYVDQGTFAHVSLATPTVDYLVVDQHEAGAGGPSGLMRNAKCRLAMSLAFDREEYVSLFYNDLYVPAYGIIPPGFTVGDLDYRNEVEEPLLASKDYKDDPDYLQGLFEEGMAEEGVEGSAGDVTLTVFTYSPSTQANSQLEWYKQQLESKLGVQVAVEIYPDSSTWVTARDSYQYDFYSMGWNGDYNDPMTFLELWTTGNGYAKFMGGYTNPEYDDLVFSAISSQDQQERLDLYAQAEEMLLNDGAVIPLVYPTKEIFYQSYVSGLSMPMFGAEFEFSRVKILAH